MLTLAERLAPIGSRNAISDVGVGALLAVAALRGAVLNVQINLPYLDAERRRCATIAIDELEASARRPRRARSAPSASRSRASSGDGAAARRARPRGHLRRELRDRVERLAETVGHGHPPVLAILTDGHHGAAALYAASLERAARSVGVETDVIVDGDALEPAIDRLNARPDVSPASSWPSRSRIVAAGRRLVEHIDPEKDVDGATPTSAGRLARGEPAFVPATALAVIAILEAYERARRRPAGGDRRPLGGRRATGVRRCSSRATRPCRLPRADARPRARDAAGGPPGRGGRRARRSSGREMVNRSAIVVDCGINATPDGIVGDVDFDEVAPVCAAITPVPGGIGPVTPMMVLRQLVEALERRAHPSPVS